MGHNLAYQINSAINSAFLTNYDKHAGKHNGESMHHVCSFGERASLRDVAFSFKKFMSDKYPSVRQIKDVTGAHWQDFLLEKSKICGNITLKNYVSRIRKIENICADKYHIQIDWHTDVVAPASGRLGGGEKLRTQAMDKDDYQKIINYGHAFCTSAAIDGIELARRFGLRDSEISKIKMSDINLTDRTTQEIEQRGNHEKIIKIPPMNIHILGKGGRDRVVPIQKNDIPFLKKIMEGKGQKDRVIPIKPASVNCEMNRIMKKINIKSKYQETSIHSIRKMRAQEIWDQYRKSGKNQKETMDMVSRYLGHGFGRYDVIKVYVANPW